MLTYIPEDKLEKGREREDAKKWDSDYLELMKYIKNSNYGKLKCFHCLLSPAGDDPIFIGINRLVVIGLTNDEPEKDPVQYPCQVVNRFQCHYEQREVKGINNKATIAPFDVQDLFRLSKMAFVIEIALAKARKDDSKIQIKGKQDLFHAITDRNMFTEIPQLADDVLKSTEYLRETYSRQDVDYMVDYFMRIRDKIDLNELRLY